MSRIYSNLHSQKMTNMNTYNSIAGIIICVQSSFFQRFLVFIVFERNSAQSDREKINCDFHRVPSKNI